MRHLRVFTVFVRIDIDDDLRASHKLLNTERIL